jgi:hypothetical protein
MPLAHALIPDEYQAAALAVTLTMLIFAKRKR